MTPANPLPRSRPDRREHARYPLGLPVVIHVGAQKESLTVEVVDIAPGGVRLRSCGRALALAERVSFGFVTPGPLSCVADGYVMRVDGGDEFILSIDQANPAFHTFVGSLGSSNDAVDRREPALDGAFR